MIEIIKTAAAVFGIGCLVAGGLLAVFAVMALGFVTGAYLGGAI